MASAAAPRAASPAVVRADAVPQLRPVPPGGGWDTVLEVLVEVPAAAGAAARTALDRLRDACSGDGGAPVAFAEAAAGMRVRLQPEGCDAPGPFAAAVLRRDADSLLLRWEPPERGGPPPGSLGIWQPAAADAQAAGATWAPGSALPAMERRGYRERVCRRAWWDGGADPRVCPVMGDHMPREIDVRAAATGSGNSQAFELAVGGLSAARRKRLGVVMATDAVKRTDIRQADVLQVKKIFDEIDDDKSGYLSLRELISFSVANPRAIPNSVFKNLVTDDDGRVHFKELLHCHFPKCSDKTVQRAIDQWAPRQDVESLDQLEEESKEEIRQIFSVFRPGFVSDFQVFDVVPGGGEGRRRPPTCAPVREPALTPAGMRHHLPVGRTGLTDVDVETLFASVDRDAGGTLGEDEFMLLLKEYFVNAQKGIGLYSQVPRRDVRWGRIFPAAGGKGGPDEYFMPPYFWDTFPPAPRPMRDLSSPHHPQQQAQQV